VAVDESPVDFYWVGSIARHAGTIVHRWLHWLATDKLKPDVGHLERLRPLGCNLALELGVPVQDVDAVCDRALHALRSILNDDKGRWILLGPGHAETPVTGIWNNRVESIIIDRIRIDEGVHWIIDYKTSTHEGGDLAGFVSQEVERYRQQLTKYMFLYDKLNADSPVMIRAALYFPLLQQFREVTVTSQ
jgi:ATP-dependent helicase/nuclease subunit A